MTVIWEGARDVVVKTVIDCIILFSGALAGEL